MRKKALTYRKSGVDTQKEEVALKYLLGWTVRTFDLRKKTGKTILKSGYFANVIGIDQEKGIAISTDGVGTKILIAQQLDKYDTVGIDCVAMNVNDVLCVGAEPLSMVDYIAVSRPDPQLLDEIGKGLWEGARIAQINIPGGEVAQVREIIQGKKRGKEFDLVGTAIGIVNLDKIITGENIEEKDIVMGLASSGIHSNGLTLARRALLQKGNLKLKSYIPELGRTLGEELLEPTLIYVPAVIEMLKKQVKIKALVHITGGGLLNLTRVFASVCFYIDNLPPPPPIFSLIQKEGNISDEEMFSVFNMGVGFCIVIPEEEIDRVMEISRKYNFTPHRIGYIKEKGESKVVIPQKKLIGKNSFRKY
ncbi:phosphoribosylformylglycinamidine cyclo-ligase [Candidatus Aerophobetes bacterium]|nr:phosphoribosylformylglycinamidine cyclo-ligase [Candidatus Aerophobetes bacterium]